MLDGLRGIGLRRRGSVLLKEILCAEDGDRHQQEDEQDVFIQAGFVLWTLIFRHCLCRGRLPGLMCSERPLNFQ